MDTERKTVVRAIVHRITEWFGLEGTFEDHLVQPPAMGRDTFH